MARNCFGGIEKHRETESFGCLGDECVGADAVIGAGVKTSYGKAKVPPMKLLRPQTDCVSALVIMGHLRKPQSVISRLWGEPCLLRSRCFFGPVALGLTLKLWVDTDLYSHQFLLSFIHSANGFGAPTLGLGYCQSSPLKRFGKWPTLNNLHE